MGIVEDESEIKWWKNTFDQKYLDTYIDTEFIAPKQTEVQINFLVEKLNLKKGVRILDLACGYGRHSIPLAELGFQVTCLDYSSFLLEKARSETKKKKLHIAFIQGDMREIRFENEFDAVISMFTSFGYFETKEEEKELLQKIYQSLKIDGVLLLDLNNSLRTVQRIKRLGNLNQDNNSYSLTSTNILSNSLEVNTKQTLSQDESKWTIERTWINTVGEKQSYEIVINLFSRKELEQILTDVGFGSTQAYGDFEGTEFKIDSPRLILVANA